MEIVASFIDVRRHGHIKMQIKIKIIINVQIFDRLQKEQYGLRQKHTLQLILNVAGSTLIRSSMSHPTIIPSKRTNKSNFWIEYDRIWYCRLCADPEMNDYALFIAY